MTYLYLLRYPVETISPALFSPTDHEATAIKIENSLSILPSENGEVFLSEDSVQLPLGRSLTYDELVGVVCEGRKVLIL